MAYNMSSYNNYGNANYNNSYNNYACPPPSDNRTANLNKVFFYLGKVDKGEKGKLSRDEIQKAMHLAFSKGDKLSGEALSTFIHGGIHQKGLFPDFNGDGQATYDEIFKIAGHDGNWADISTSDFYKGFPGEAKPGGNTIPGYGNQPPYNKPPSYNNKPGNQYGGGQQQFIQKLLMLLLQIFGGMGKGGYNQGGNGFQVR